MAFVGPPAALGAVRRPVPLPRSQSAACPAARACPPVCSGESTPSRGAAPQQRMFEALANAVFEARGAVGRSGAAAAVCSLAAAAAVFAAEPPAHAFEVRLPSGIQLEMPRPFFAKLKDYGVLDAPIEEVQLQLGMEDGSLRFVPDSLELVQGHIYRLKMSNPSKMTHYFTPGDFANKIFTVFVSAGDPRIEVKGPVQEVALKAGASLEWTLIPMKPGEYPFRCSVKGHTEAGMIGKITVVPPK
eukprot:tig00021312_g20054.t1